jgi:hypothetical protein
VSDKFKNRLTIDTDQSGRIRIHFSLSKPKKNVFSKKLPLYKIDDGIVHDLKDARQLITDTKKSRWIRWTVSKKKSPISKELEEIMNGNQFTIQYYLQDGTIKETTFNINNADKVIQELVQKSVF